MKEKKCTDCGIVKPIHSFYKITGGKYGVGSRCKSCWKKYSSGRYETHKEIIQEKQREYYQKNYNKLKRKQKEYYSANLDVCRKKRLKYYHDHKELKKKPKK